MHRELSLQIWVALHLVDKVEQPFDLVDRSWLKACCAYRSHCLISSSSSGRQSPHRLDQPRDRFAFLSSLKGPPFAMVSRAVNASGGMRHSDVFLFE